MIWNHCIKPLTGFDPFPAGTPPAEKHKRQTLAMITTAPRLTLKSRKPAATGSGLRLTLRRSAAAVRDMQPQPAATPAVFIRRDEAQVKQLTARVAELEAAETARSEAEKATAHRLHYLNSRTAHIRDNRATYGARDVVITSSSAFTRLAIEPSKAVPMRLPLLALIKRLLLRR